MPIPLATLRARLGEGMVIPAHPLALDADRRLDERHQRALSRYYLAAGAGGLAVGVHTTQFEIHDPHVGLYPPVLRLAREEAERFAGAGGGAPVLVAGVVGPTAQAVEEAALARDLGYDCALLSLAALRDASAEELLAHVRAVAEELPVFGFYLQPAVGGRELPYAFWRRFADIPKVVGIKIAPFDRYRTLDVVRAVADAARLDQIAMYTGNDDSILLDLLTPFPYGGARIVGGLLGQWAVWTRRAVELLEEVRATRATGGAISPELLTRNAELTDANAAIFDPGHRFAGCIPGIHEILRRQGLMRGRWTLNPSEDLSPGQLAEIDRVCACYPHLTDDDFVARHLAEWLC
jgi:dihydrodipicolinate synthase/N-acetylneuraminate lyase